MSAYVARSMGLVDRAAVDLEVQRLKGSPEYRAIVRMKKLSPP